MTAIRCNSVLAVSLLVAFLAASSSAAPPAGAYGDPYGQGVQAFFSGNSSAAEPFFAEAMGRNPKDPRPFYFHGLSLLRQSRTDEARSDFMIAASLEARSRNAYPVGKSLERVQGADRLLLEQYRWQARAAEGAIFSSVSPANASPGPVLTLPAEQRAMRQQVSVPLDRLVQPVSLSELVERSTNSPPTTASNPFVDDISTAPEGKISSGKLMGIVGRALMQSAPVPSLEGLRERIPGLPSPATSNPSAQANVEFGSEASSPSAGDDPFGEPATDSAAPSESEPAAVEPEEDPFG